jgi:hypothetical protein
MGETYRPDIGGRGVVAAYSSDPEEGRIRAAAQGSGLNDKRG